MGSFFYYILLGTIVTIGVTLVALPFGLVIGLLMALVHTYGGKILKRIASAYSILLRGVPPIVLLFILFFVLSGSIDLGALSRADLVIEAIVENGRPSPKSGSRSSASSGSCSNRPATVGSSSWPTAGLAIRARTHAAEGGGLRPAVLEPGA